MNQVNSNWANAGRVAPLPLTNQAENLVEQVQQFRPEFDGTVFNAD